MGNDCSSKDVDSDRIERDQSGPRKALSLSDEPDFPISPRCNEELRHRAAPTSPAIDDKPLDFLDLSLVRSMISMRACSLLRFFLADMSKEPPDDDFTRLLRLFGLQFGTGSAFPSFD